MTKQAIYNKYGINFQNGKIDAPVFGWIKPLLVNGNAKLGKNVWTWSTLPTNELFDINVGLDHNMIIAGTCPCHCKGCYATKGCYNFSSTKKANAIKTVLSYKYLDFVKRAISAQLEADKIQFVRIHAAGDFFSQEYIEAWQDIVKAFPEVTFWTYTKNQAAESAFDSYGNANVVKSLIPNIGLNFGHCDHVLNAYSQLKAAGENVYICRCGIDKNQHCNNCKGCSVNKYVLFIEHSTEYEADADPLFEALRSIIESQAKPC